MFCLSNHVCRIHCAVGMFLAGLIPISAKSLFISSEICCLSTVSILFQFSVEEELSTRPSEEYGQYGHGRTKFWQKDVELSNMNLSHGNAQQRKLNSRFNFHLYCSFLIVLLTIIDLFRPILTPWPDLTPSQNGPGLT